MPVPVKNAARTNVTGVRTVKVAVIPLYVPSDGKLEIYVKRKFRV